MIRFTLILFFIAITGIQSQVERTTTLNPYEFYMKITQGEQEKGHYREKLSKEKKLWNFETEKIFLNDKGRFTSYEHLSLVFSPQFQLISYRKTLQTSKGKKVWYKGTVVKNHLVLKNSRGVSNQIKLEGLVIPKELSILYFLTQKETIVEHQSLDIVSGEIAKQHLEVDNVKTIDKSLEQVEEIVSDVVYKVGVLIVKSQFIAKDGKKESIYEIAMSGTHVIPGVLLKINNAKDEYTWDLKILSGKPIHFLKPKPPKKGTSRSAHFAKLRQSVAKLLSSDPLQRYRAIVEIREIVNRAGLWHGVPAIIEMLKDEDERVKKTAHQVLVSLTKKKYPPRIKKWRRWWIIYRRRNKDKLKIPTSELDNQ